MPKPTLAIHAWVLGRRPTSDSFQSLTLFSADPGQLTALHRVSTKAGRSEAPAAPDLFDETAFLLESSNQGQTWFVREARLLRRHAEIGRSYAALERASAFAQLVARNDVPAESRERIYSLLGSAFGAFATAADPEVVSLKAVYRLAHDEGYPVRQQWFDSLPAELRAIALSLLRTPLSAIAAEPQAGRLRRRLEEYLQGHTDLVFS